MRHVDTSQVLVAANWSRRATRASGKVAAARATRKQQTNEINRGQKIWSDFKPILSDLTDNKCWYCEARHTRFDMMVDHFRPKNGVEEDSTHWGYWWLAFCPANFRLACDYCNCLHPNETEGRSLGKQNHFPLLPEGCRANTPDDNLLLERPLLLDPTSKDDPDLLTHNETGYVEPTNWNIPSYEYLRARRSIEIYNLNDPDTVFRRAQLVADVKKLIDIADALAQVSECYALQFEQAKTLIKERIVWNAEFSTLSFTIARGYVDLARPWLNDLIREANSY